MLPVQLAAAWILFQSMLLPVMLLDKVG